jgi:SAM-dependent methyltransferase
MHDKFKYRSDEKELLDKSDILPELVNKNLKELDLLNRTTGGYSVTLKGIQQLITDHNKTYQIVDLGCGSGGALKIIADWARKKSYKVKLTGVDVNANAIDYLKRYSIYFPEINGIVADYRDYLDNNKIIDVVHCSLFCHHLNDDELLRLVILFRENLKTGFIINDLQRNWQAYFSAWFFTRLFNGSVLSKNDGPVSVLRGFKTDELVLLLKKAGVRNCSVQKEWLFRFLVVGKTENNGSTV